MEKTLTQTQTDILEFIKTTWERLGAPPSYREIQAHFGYKAVGTVQDHVKALQKKGKLEKGALSTRGPRKARTLLPVGLNLERTKNIPIYGEIAAGTAREAEQLELGFLNVAVSAVKDPSFALRVVGDSMIDVGILEGDVLLVERKSDAADGDIVVALVEGEMTVKRYRRFKGKILLVPENRRLAPIDVTNRRHEIQGKVVGLQRKI